MEVSRISNKTNNLDFLKGHVNRIACLRRYLKSNKYLQEFYQVPSENNQVLTQIFTDERFFPLERDQSKIQFEKHVVVYSISAFAI